MRQLKEGDVCMIISNTPYCRLYDLVIIAAEGFVRDSYQCSGYCKLHRKVDKKDVPTINLLYIGEF